MISVGIDVAKDKHDCFIINSEGVVLADVFTIPNNMEGFIALLDKIRACSTPQDSIKVGLEVYIGQKHSRNRSRIHPIRLRLSQTETLPVEIGA